MAKLIVVCLLAAWLTVALADSEDKIIDAFKEQLNKPNLFVKSYGIGMKALENKATKSVQEWRALEKGYSLKLRIKFLALDADTVYKLLVKINEAQKHSDQDTFPKYVITELLSYRQRIECDLKSSIIGPIEKFYLYQTNWSLRNYLADSFSRYLDHCKYEEMFVQAIRALGQVKDKPWNWIKYPTLYQYWKKNLRPLGEKDEEHVETETIWLTRLVKNISSLKEMSEIECTKGDLRDRLVGDLIKSNLYYPELYTLVNAYFKKYLSACGLQDRFKTAMADCEIQTKGLDYYLKGDSWGPNDKNSGEFEARMKLAIPIVSRLVGPSQIDTSHCTKDYTAYLHDDLRKIEKTEYTELRECLGKILRRQSDVCRTNFIAKGKAFKDNQQDNWSRVEMFKTAMEKLKPAKTLKDMQIGVEAFKVVQGDGSWTDGKHGLTVTDLKRDVEQPCEAFFDEMVSSKEALHYEEIQHKTFVMEFYVPFEYCAILLGKELRNEN